MAFFDNDTLIDENILTITYGDGATEEVNRIELAGQYIFKTYADLYDADDNYVDTVLLNYYCYEENDELNISENPAFEYNDKNYRLVDWGTFPEDMDPLGIGTAPGVFGGSWIMPGRDIEHHFKFKEAYAFSFTATYNEEIIVQSTEYVAVGKSYTAAGNIIEENSTAYYCSDSSSASIDSMPREDVDVTLEYIPIFSTGSNTHPDCFIKGYVTTNS